MTRKWRGTLLPLDDHKYRGRCSCGELCAPNYEHCDSCLVGAVRGMFQVDRAVERSRKARLDVSRDGP